MVPNLQANNTSLLMNCRSIFICDLWIVVIECLNACVFVVVVAAAFNVEYSNGIRFHCVIIYMTKVMEKNITRKSLSFDMTVKCKLKKQDSTTESEQEEEGRGKNIGGREIAAKKAKRPTHEIYEFSLKRRTVACLLCVFIVVFVLFCCCCCSRHSSCMNKIGPISWRQCDKYTKMYR